MMTVLTNARHVTAGGIVDDSWFEIEDDLITATGTGSRPGGADLGAALVTPGFVDMHVHGAVGALFSDTSETDVQRLVAFHRSYGTTTLLAGLSARPAAAMAAAASRLVPLADRGEIAGIFHEGPFLSQDRRGAQDPMSLQMPDSSTIDHLLHGGAGHTRMMTIAPELDGALDAIAALASAGVVVAVGHTDASYEQAREAFAAGASVATHLFNGMRPIHHRDPGPVVAAMDDERVVCEVIADGHHLDDATLRFIFEHIGGGRTALVTDAISAVGLGDGTYDLDGSAIRVRQGMAELADGSSLAGSTLTMDAALRRVVERAGVPLPIAVTSATRTPARALGLGDRVGTLTPGLRADLVVLDDHLRVTRVMRGGRWVSDRHQESNASA
jgi:N-acetylglucosamine-6-phosphate deacetylase